MNTALIFAGGTGQRINSRAKPKQFLELHGKPVIMFTIEHFEQCSEIDNTVVVCLKSYIDELEMLLRRYEIKKVSQIVPGGITGHESIYNGLSALESVCSKDDIVLIHDGVRPLITEELIIANIAKVKECGNAITVEAAIESVVRLNENGLISEVPPRDSMYSAKAPQSFRYGMIWDLYQKARSENLATIDSAHLCNIYGVEMHTVKSSPNNIKITTSRDYYIFRALYEVMENQQIWGID